MTYLLRDVDPALWRLVKSKAALEGLTVREAICKLLKEWTTPRKARSR